ncbi:hypothetical protein RHS01_08646 [Rhizoctonia solani]|uniref:Uncharacterized protein n=1 Tax=Rhizoctonia solani TaxID=456999 RepID=A0A8H7I7B2_9AGAM|nr:hypothetical protein RHS01_08646 [Rhizoctonia solani]
MELFEKHFGFTLGIYYLARMQRHTVLPLDYPLDTPLEKSPLIWGKQAEEFLPKQWIGKKIDEVTQTDPACLESILQSFQDDIWIGFLRLHRIQICEVMLAELVTNFKFEPGQEECVWVNHGIQFPYAKKDIPYPDKFPKLFLKVSEI